MLFINKFNKLIAKQNYFSGCAINQSIRRTCNFNDPVKLGRQTAGLFSAMLSGIPIQLSRLEKNREVVDVMMISRDGIKHFTRDTAKVLFKPDNRYHYSKLVNRNIRLDENDLFITVSGAKCQLPIDRQIAVDYFEIMLGLPVDTILMANGVNIVIPTYDFTRDEHMRVIKLGE